MSGFEHEQWGFHLDKAECVGELRLYECVEGERVGVADGKEGGVGTVHVDGDTDGTGKFVGLDFHAIML
ncbi:hypothetical protein [Lepagella muris]|uniref:Uncharacterized protein n=1 Tax=Lepagella muris TaxID=3032870 RepID=A0AC61RJG6_9BACT|nr:hypothetical protein [Lepagella muris]TGY79777.1 hypothetical protein E5331_05215 [Lepagella muris]THG51819.1 hypothetical protein E5984_09935 [Bacteroidales bacterium]TKC54395.1 hypothetical protein E5359_018240 [Bacteroidales bacterium]